MGGKTTFTMFRVLFVGIAVIIQCSIPELYAEEPLHYGVKPVCAESLEGDVLSADTSNKLMEPVESITINSPFTGAMSEHSSDDPLSFGRGFGKSRYDDGGEINPQQGTIEHNAITVSYLLGI